MKKKFFYISFLLLCLSIYPQNKSETSKEEKSIDECKQLKLNECNKKRNCYWVPKDNICKPSKNDKKKEGYYDPELFE